MGVLGAESHTDARRFERLVPAPRNGRSEKARSTPETRRRREDTGELVMPASKWHRDRERNAHHKRHAGGIPGENHAASHRMLRHRGSEVKRTHLINRFLNYYTYTSSACRNRNRKNKKNI